MQSVFILDDDPIRHLTLKSRFVDASITAAHAALEAMHLLQDGPYDLACLDHDLGDWYEGDDGELHELTGMDVVRYLIDEVPRDRWPKEVIVHSWNGMRGRHMVDLLKDNGVKASYWPFTP